MAMKTDGIALFTDEEEETCYKKQKTRKVSEIFVDKVNSTNHSCLMSIGKKTGLMTKVRGAESCDECNVSTCCDSKAKISLTGIKKQKNGRYVARITDPIKHKQVHVGVFDTIEEASQAYLSKKSEFENKWKKNFEQPESPSVSASGRDRRIDSRERTTRIIGAYRRKKTGRYYSKITNPITKKKISLGTFDTAEEASRAFQSKKLEFQKLVDVKQEQCANKHSRSNQDGTTLSGGLVNVKRERENLICHERFQHGGEAFRVCQSKNKQAFSCNTTTSWNTKAKRSFVGIKRQMDRGYAAVITDRVKHRKVWFDTFDTIEEASQAYSSKKSEFEELSQQGNKENKSMKNCDQIQQPESSSVVSLREKRIDSHGKEAGSSKARSCLMTNVCGGESPDERSITTNCDPKAKISLIGIRRRKSGRYAAVITDPIRHKEVCVGTFDTIEEASQAYFSKKSEFDKLRQQGKTENKLKKNCDPIQQPESSSVMASLDTAGGSGRGKRIESHKRTTHIIGVYKSKSLGKFTSEIRDPITKKTIWLGTFDTAEEASHAFQSKKLEFQKLVQAKQKQCTHKQTHSKEDRKSEKSVHAKQEHENLNCGLESVGGPRIDFPMSNTSNGGTDQRINPHETGIAEDAFHACLSEKFYSQSSKEVELQSNMSTDSCAGKNQQGQEDDDKDLWMGKWVQLGDRTVMFSLKLGLPIIDNYGSLLGEFSSLDDLSII
ncbi:hypothetical protein P3S68_000229 [Capsicum galapagoense]